MKDINKIKAYWMATMAMGETREEMEQFWSTKEGMEDLMNWFDAEIEAGLTEEEMNEAIKEVEKNEEDAMTYEEFMELAKANYTKGGDGFYECWEEYQFNDYVKMFGPITKKKALEMFKQNAGIDAEYEAAAKWASGMDYNNEIKEDNEMKEATRFELNGKVYEKNEKGNRFFISDEANDIYRKRIGEAAYEQAWDEYLSTVNEADEEFDAEDEVKARKEAEEQKDRETEEKFNKKQTKKAAKPRRSKDVAFEMDTLAGHITLTAKQVDFIKHLPDTSFWENGLDSTPWCDVLADEIGGQFAGKPMAVGAMISTLREKKLVVVGQEVSRQGKPKYLALTDLGKVIAKKLGLN